MSGRDVAGLEGPDASGHLVARERAVGAYGSRAGPPELRGGLGRRVAHDGEVAPGEGAEGHGDEDGQGRNAPDAAQGRQGLAQVVLGLDDEEMGTAVGQAPGLLGESGDELLLEAGPLRFEELSGRPDAAGDEAAGRGAFPGQAGGGEVQLVGPGLEPVGGQLDRRSRRSCWWRRHRPRPRNRLRGRS